jgi:hypothetical protein
MIKIVADAMRIRISGTNAGRKALYFGLTVLVRFQHRGQGLGFWMLSSLCPQPKPRLEMR